MDIQKIGVIGGGQMGGGIAQVCALKGFDVAVLDISEDALAKGRERLEKAMNRDVEKGRTAAEDRDDAFARMSWSTEYAIMGDRDMVIEAATEDEEIKKAILRELCTVVPEHTLIASNTSSISITRLAAQTDRPGQFCGMHFMNPVPRMQLVELIRGIATDEDTYQTVRELTDKLGKTAVNAEDFPAFIVNRILLPMINEAVYTLYEGVGSVAAIDTAMKLGTNHPMGPLELADFIGLDTCLAVMHVLHEGLADTKYRPCPLLTKYVEAGWLGKKTNRGFYDYSGDEPVPTR
ncbi:MAG: 3-hydroxybutyryl-CoA dehydrogenase [Rhodospirillaceae bacterium]|jgi:3-hydroxybutyryl-CoA dehydrogenase|nr:3-hydroxybutyryl-CoA dehydrogenase [Rhodospirillaceae bacterium]